MDQMLKSLTDGFAFTESAQEQAYDLQLSGKSQGDADPMTFVLEVVAIVQDFYRNSSEATVASQAEFIEKTAANAIITRSSLAVQEEIKRERQRWDERSSSMSTPNSLLYSLVALVLKRFPPGSTGSKRKRIEDKVARMCHFGAQCPRIATATCSFNHDFDLPVSRTAAVKQENPKTRKMMAKPIDRKTSQANVKWNPLTESRKASQDVCSYAPCGKIGHKLLTILCR